MTRLLALLPLTAALLLAACDDQNADQAEGPELNEYDSPEPAAPAPEEEETADAPPTDLTPAEEAVDIVQDAAGALTNLAAEQLNQVTDGQPLDEAASELASDVVTSLSEQLDNASEGLSQVASDLAGAASETADAVQDGTQDLASDAASAAGDAVDATQDATQELAAAADEAMTADVDWQSAFSPDVPYYNLSEEPVMAYTEPNGSEVAGTVAPGGGGFIETCNESLDWCLVPFGEDGESGWVDMSAFGGVAN
ncbi:MAG: hypothetical protein JJ908_07955 [Rhizobiales bacterium]|nr:hypothetical protein [Hyphomicrobiales bacterium]MBO6697459.1 hypothetical protein [Hyphomicrobiales bacterium]MBO6736286.1 hypothetical protein [Hyphomicrobiales bacterium]MBO6912756.1 hypothetical protein [Hyphomicrobiales bacterium]MBO6953925.1 hypothetical protein [Hyphomicrobiales bacterium]